MLKCPLYNSMKNKSSSIFENVILGSVKSLFQSKHQVNISLYCTEATALYHSRKLASLKPS